MELLEIIQPNYVYVQFKHGLYKRYDDGRWSIDSFGYEEFLNGWNKNYYEEIYQEHVLKLTKENDNRKN